MQNKNLMITGSPAKRIISFALPLMLGNFFQQLYNTADSLIVGNFLGSNALAAVSSAGNLIFLMIGFFQGVSAGAGVVIAHFLGARELERTRKAVHTTIAIGLMAGLFLMVFGVLATPWMLRTMHTPEAVMPDSVAYFRNFFYGAIGVVMYNTCVGILQASGDSKHPLYFLIVSSVTNVVLDLVFIMGLGMGAGAAGLATAISSLLSAMLCLRRLIFQGGEVAVNLREVRIDGGSLRRILYNGVPSGLQNSIIAISNVLIQSSINSLGPAMMSGMGTYAKIEGFAFLPITSFTMAITTYIGQNLGAGEKKRAADGARFGVRICCICAELIGIVIFAFAPAFIAAFDRTPEVIAIGTMKSRYTVMFYFMLAFSHAISAVMRGAGRSIVPMMVMLACWCILRVAILEVCLKGFHFTDIIYFIHPLTWTLSTIVFSQFYIGFLKKNSIEDTYDSVTN